MRSDQNFPLGSIIVPAQDSSIRALGHDIQKLGSKAIGILIEEGSDRALIHFPYLRLTTWLNFTEIKDVLDESRTSSDFKRLLPTQNPVFKNHLAWVFHDFLYLMNAQMFLGIEYASFDELWEDKNEDNLYQKTAAKYALKDLTNCCRLSIGLNLLREDILSELEKKHSELFVEKRILPSGMYKFELALYFQTN